MDLVRRVNWWRLGTGIALNGGQKYRLHPEGPFRTAKMRPRVEQHVQPPVGEGKGPTPEGRPPRRAGRRSPAPIEEPLRQPHLLELTLAEHRRDAAVS